MAWRIILLTLVAGTVAIMGTANKILASDYSSASFIVRDPTASQGGITSGSSSSYQMRGSFGDTAPGRGTSSSYADASGFHNYDDTAPLTGVVNDGTGADIDQQVSMTALSANWSGFSDLESGIAKYEYRLRRQIDNNCWDATANAWATCDVWNNTGLAATITVSNIALLLRTGTLYDTCVRATNNVSLVSTVICSNGVSVTPSLSLGLNANTLALPDLNPANSWDASAATALTIQSNSYSGYNVYVTKTSLLRSIRNPAYTITDLSDSGCVGTAVAWPGPTNFGISSTATIDSNKFNVSGTRYCAIPNSGTGLNIANRIGPILGAQVSDSFTINYRATATGSQPADTYQTQVEYTVVAQY